MIKFNCVLYLWLVLIVNDLCIEAKKITGHDPILNNKDILTGMAKERAPDTLTSYDQRQTGKYNVHFNIKDVQLFSVRGDEFNTGVGDGMEYDYGDYDYDPSHFTINPIMAMLGSESTTATSTTTEKHSPPLEGAYLNLPDDKEPEEKETSTPSASPVVEITSKPIVTVSTNSKPLEQSDVSKLEATSSKPVVDELTTEYEKVPFEMLMDPILRQLLRNNQKHNKAPFRLKAVYKRPHKYRVSPRRVLNEFVIEGVPNRLDDEISNQDPLHLAVGLPSRPLQNLPNPNNFVQQTEEATTRRPRRTRRPSEDASCFDGEYLDNFGRCIKIKEDKGEL